MGEFNVEKSLARASHRMMPAVEILSKEDGFEREVRVTTSKAVICQCSGTLREVIGCLNQSEVFIRSRRHYEGQKAGHVGAACSHLGLEKIRKS